MIARYNIGRLTGLLLALGLWGHSLPVTAQPQVNLKVTRFEFGMFPDRSTVAHTFWFKSSPSDTLRLVDVKTGCGCVRAERNQNFAAPGDSLPVTLIWKPDTETDTSQTAYVFFYGSPDPVRLTLATGAISPDPMLTVTPGTVEFPTAAGARKESAGIRVTNTTERELDLKIVSAPSDKLTVVLPDKLDKKKLVAAQLGLTEPADTTRFERSMTIEATDPANKKVFRVTIPIRRGANMMPATDMVR